MAVTLGSSPTHLCQLSCLVCPGDGGGQGVVLFPMDFFFKDLSGRHKTFKICDHIRGKVAWLLGGCSVLIWGSSLLSIGPWPLRPFSGIRKPTASEFTSPFQMSMLDLPSLRIPGKSVFYRAETFNLPLIF